MLVPVLLFLLGLCFLIKGGDWFVDGSCGIARRFRIPEFIIGATVVSIGTTLPEVMVSATGALNGHSQMAYGNAVGSIICNTALIAALTVAIAPSVINKKTIRLPVYFFFAAAVFYSVSAVVFRRFSRLTGVVLLCIFVFYIVLTLTFSKKNRSVDGKEETPDAASSVRKDILMLVAGGALVAVGARLLVDNGTIIAEKLGVPESVIALTFVALGTSLPELVTAITSLVKGHGALSLGNIVGANLFNLVLVSGLSVTLSPFSIPADKLVLGVPASLAVDIPLMFVAMGILVIPPMIKGKLSRWQGIVLLCIYASFCVFQFVC